MHKLSNRRKIEIVFRSFQKDAVITDLCKKHGISRSTFYRYKNCVLEVIAKLMVSRKKPLRKERTKKQTQAVQKHYYWCKLK